MDLRYWIARRLLILASTAAAAVLGGGIVAGLASLPLCGSLVATDAGGGMPVEGTCRTIARFGTTCFVAGIAVALSLLFVRQFERVNDLHPESRRWLHAALAALAVGLTLATVRPLLFVRDEIELLSGLEGFFMMAPLFALATTAILSVAAWSLVLLFPSRDRLCAKGYVVFVAAHVAFVLCNHYASELAGVLRVIATEFPIVLQSDDLVIDTVRLLTWLLPLHAFVIGTAALSSPGSREMRAAGTTLPLPPRLQRGHLARTAPTAFTSSKYFVQMPLLSWPGASTLAISDQDGVNTFNARLTPLSLKPEVVIARPGDDASILTLEARNLFGIPASYDIREAGADQVIATASKKLGSEWVIHDEQHSPMAIVTATHLTIGAAEYDVRVDDETVASLKWSNAVTPLLQLEFHGSHDVLDRRLTVAVAVLLFFNLAR